MVCLFFFFFKQKTAYEMRISDWSSDVCSSDLADIGGQAQASERPGGGQEARARIFGIKPRLKRMAGDSESILSERQRFSAGHTNLPFDQILPGDRLGHRMFDLTPGVHFHEPDAV